MAIKVALAAALMVALVAVASATTYTTTVTTTTIEEEANPRSQQCRQQVQGREFRACQSYLQQRRGSPYMEEEAVIEANPQRESVEECCEQLREMDQYQCGCEAIKQAVRQVQQQGGRSYQTGQSEQIYQKARQLPRLCRLRDQQCSFNLVLA